MAEVRALLIRGPGTNCEIETAHVWKQAGAVARAVHVHALIEHPQWLLDAHILTIPGGFCYGDDIAAGKIMACELRLRLADALQNFVAAGKLVLGICNGFQVLVKTGLLPGPVVGESQVTLTLNNSGRYEDRWVHLKPSTTRCKFIDGDALLHAPVAHAEGRIVTHNEASLRTLADGGYVAYRYVDERGQPQDYPVNPNGSIDSIAGLTDHTGQVLGLMPHPERNSHFTHHPLWTRLTRDRQPDGMRLFQTAVNVMR